MRSQSRLFPLGAVLLSAGLAWAGPAWAAVCNVPDMTHGTIQSAADDVNCTEIVLAAQTFIEQVTIGRAGSIFLHGAGAGRTVIKSPAVRVASTLPTTYYPGYTYIIQIKPGTAANIADLTVDGTGNSFCGEPLFGVRFNNATGSVDRTVVDNVRSPDADFGCQNGVAVAATSDGGGTASLSMDRSTVRNFQKVGILVNGASAGGILTNNIVRGVGSTARIAQVGIQFSRGATGAVDTNTLTGMHFTGDTCIAGGISQASGLLMFQAGSVFLTKNTLIDIDRAIWLQENVGAQTVSQNRVYSSNVGISSQGNATGVVRISANSVTGSSLSTAINAGNCFADSGDGISVATDNGTVVIQNSVADSARDAFELQAGTQSLDVEQNKAVRSGRVDIENSGTGNSVALNACKTSSPAGLCALAP